MLNEPHPIDAYQPREIAHRVETMGVTKARLDGWTTLILAFLAGAFISFGAIFYAVIVTGSELGFGVTRFLGGIGFSLGLILVVVGGAELFTGNNLIAMAWASRRITTRELLRNWAIAYLGNALGCLGTVILVLMADVDGLNKGAVGETLIQIAASKAALSPLVALTRGILCNVLVCLAVWLTVGGHSVTDKIVAMLLPVCAFVTLGLEHSIANWFFLPIGWELDTQGKVPLQGVCQNLLVVSLGNIVGGTLLVAGVYWMAYLRNAQSVPPPQ